VKVVPIQQQRDMKPSMTLTRVIISLVKRIGGSAFALNSRDWLLVATTLIWDDTAAKDGLLGHSGDVGDAFHGVGFSVCVYRGGFGCSM
jgi:hypothetical protein